MILDQDDGALRQWIVEAAHGRVPVPRWDESPWDAFYSEYRSAAANTRARVDHAFRALSTHPDEEVREAVVVHWQAAEAAVGFDALVELLQRHAPLYAHQQPPGSSFTLRARLLDGLATCASGDAARDHLLRHAAGAGVLPGQVGSYLGGLGAAAVDAFVAARPDDGVIEAVRSAGWMLHADGAQWADAQRLAAKWPTRLRDALERGAAEHRATFGGP